MTSLAIPQQSKSCGTCIGRTSTSHTQQPTVSLYLLSRQVAQCVFNHLIKACTWTIWSTVPSTIPYIRSQLTYGMEMIFHQQVKFNWQLLKYQRHLQAIANNKQESKTQINHDYIVGDLEICWEILQACQEPKLFCLHRVLIILFVYSWPEL